MQNKIKRIYNIEPEKKLNKLFEEVEELAKAVKNYIADPTDKNMNLALGELIDVGIVLFQLAFIKHGYYIAEIYGMAVKKIDLNVSIYKTMVRDKIGYKEARAIHRGGE